MKHPLLHLLVTLSLATGVTAKVETWTDFDGRSMEAELVSATDKYASFLKTDGTRYSFPIEKLSEADQARVRELAATLPPAPATPAAPVPQAVAGKFTSEMSGKLVSLKGKTLSPHSREAIQGAKYYALYYSAKWCPPCRGFTPELVTAYNELKAKHPDFEVIFVSSDEDQDAMQSYMTDYKMPWPAVRFDLVKSLSAVKRHKEKGIPNLVFLTADGEVLSTSYVNGKYVGPRKVLGDIKSKLDGKN
jgi:nucleoredoxin